MEGSQFFVLPLVQLSTLSLYSGISLQLFQANQAGSSSSMEFLTFQKAFTLLLGTKIQKVLIKQRENMRDHWQAEKSLKHLEEVKSVTFHAFLSHVLNKHKDLPNRLFNACAHGNITTPHVWVT
ncbi:hypothetical protein pdam_00014677, partial [Pocillopora damicornis]